MFKHHFDHLIKINMYKNALDEVTDALNNYKEKVILKNDPKKKETHITDLKPLD